MNSLKERYGKWALVTGGSSGIGLGLTTALADAGINTIIISNQQQQLDAARKSITEEYDVEIVPCLVDLAESDFLTTVESVVGDREIGILINNASYGMVGDFLDHPIESYQNMVDVNISAYLKLTHHFLQPMKERNQGACIFTSSLNAMSPVAKSAVYTSTKAFELYFGGALWYEMRDTAVDVLTIMPGPTRTGFQKKAQTKEASWIKDPFELAEEALAVLGKQMTFIPDEENNILAGVLGRFELEDRTKYGSMILEKTLLKGEL